jgi:hypothetical protein
VSLWRKRGASDTNRDTIAPNVHYNGQNQPKWFNMTALANNDLSIKSKEHMNKTYDHELVKRMIDEAVKAEREACSVDAEWCIQNHLEQHIPKRIRARGQA